MPENAAPSTDISPNLAKLEAELTLPEGQEAPAEPVETTPAPVVDTPAPETPVEQPETPVEGAPETPETPAAPVAEEEDPDELPPPDKAKQIRLKGPDFQFAKLVKSGLTPAEAFAKVYGGTPSATPAPETPAAPVAPEPTAAEKRLAEVQAKLAEFSESESLYTKDIDTLQQERAELIADIKLEKRFAQARKAEIEEHERAQEAERRGQAFDQQYDEAIAKVVEKFGDVGKEENQLGTAILARIIEISESDKHPFREVAKRGELLPIHVMHEVAESLGIAPLTTQSPKATSTPATSKVPAMLPAPGSTRTTPVVPVNDAQRRAQLATDLAQARTPEAKARILSASLGGEEEVTDGRFAMA